MHFLFLLFFPLLLLWQTRQTDLRTVFLNIQEEVSRNSEAYQRLEYATSNIGHRLTGSPNGAKAEEYAYNLLRSYGYKDVAFQPFEVEAWSRETVTLDVELQGRNMQPAVVSLAHSPVHAEVRAELIDVGSGLTSDFERLKGQVKGKIAFFYISKIGKTNEKNLHRSEKTALAIQHGAVGIIIYNQVEGGILLTGTASVTGELIPIPAVCIGYEDGLEIRKQLADEQVFATIKMRNRSDKIKARNIIATLKGSEKPDEVILIGGHLDSWDLATGAIDNGIGSFAIIEMARVFQKLNLRPKRTIQFVLFMGEEEGLLGSKAMVQQHLKNKTLDRIKLMMNLDMTGNPIGFNVGGRNEMLELVCNIGDQIMAIDTAYRNEVQSRAGLHSDHQPFLLEGLPVMAPIGNLDTHVFGCYHSSCDDFHLVNRSHIERLASVTAMMLYGLADADKILAKRFTSLENRDFLIRADLKQPLILGKDWVWEK